MDATARDLDLPGTAHQKPCVSCMAGRHAAQGRIRSYGKPPSDRATSVMSQAFSEPERSRMLLLGGSRRAWKHLGDAEITEADGLSFAATTNTPRSRLMPARCRKGCIEWQPHGPPNHSSYSLASSHDKGPHGHTVKDHELNRIQQPAPSFSRHLALQL